MCLLHFKLQLMQQEQTADLGYIQVSAFACEKLTCNVCLGLWFFFSHFEYQLMSLSCMFAVLFLGTSLNFILLEFATNFRLLIARLQNGRGFSVVLNGEFGLWSSLFSLFWTWRFELYLKLIRDNLAYFISQI